jgi:MATE family multidrug resistance protein
VSGVPTRRILAVAIPALGTLAADPLLSLVDTAFVGRLGTAELAALGVDSAIFGFAFVLFNFLAYATTPLVAGARGAGRVDEAGRIVMRAMVLAVIIGVVLTAILVIGARLLVTAMQAGPEVVEPAVAYLRIRALGLPAVLLITASNGAYRGFEDTRTPLLVALVVNVVNLVLDPILIFVAGFGIEGAAWASMAAQWLGAGLFLALLRLRAEREQWPVERVTLSGLVPFLRTGWLLIVRTALLVGSLTAATAVAARIGTRQVAAHQVLSQVWFLLAMIVDAIAIAAQTLVASLLGAGARDEARALTRRLLRWGGRMGVALGVAVFLGREWLGVAFTVDRAVRVEIAGVAPIAALMQPAAAVLFVLDGVFIGTLSVRLLARSTFAGFMAVLVMLGVTLGLDLGLAGVWWAIAAMVLARLTVLGRAYAANPLSG